MPKKPRPPRPQSSIENDDSDDDVFDIELYENEGNAPKPDSFPPTENTGEVSVAVAEIKDTKDVVYDVHKLLKSAFIAIVCILFCVIIIMILSFLDIGGVGIAKDQNIDGRTYSGGSSVEQCEEGWVGSEGWLINGDQINMGCLWFEQTGMRIAQALEFCTNRTSRLVEIHTRIQHFFIKEKLKALDPRNYTSTYFWTGASDFENENQWLWRSTRLGVEAWVWHSYYGYDNGGSDDDMALHPSFDYNGFAQIGSSYSYHPICQRPS